MNILDKLDKIVKPIKTVMIAESVTPKRAFHESIVWMLVVFPVTIGLMFLNWYVVVVMLLMWFAENILRTRWANARAIKADDEEIIGIGS